MDVVVLWAPEATVFIYVYMSKCGDTIFKNKVSCYLMDILFKAVYSTMAHRGRKCSSTVAAAGRATAVLKEL